MAAIKAEFRSTAKCFLFWRSVQIASLETKHFSTHHLSVYSRGKRLPYVAFLIGFGVAGFVGFSGLLHRRSKRKVVIADAVSNVKEYDSGGSSHVANNHVSKSTGFQHFTRTLQGAIDESRSMIAYMKEETGSPGVAVAVSIDGKLVWSEGFGFADVENRVLCSANTVMRIASISKPLAATAVAKLWEEKKLDLDAPIQTYVPSFPQKTVDGSPVTLTTRHLLSHLGGIRHYDKTLCNKETSSQDDKKSKDETVNTKEIKSRIHTTTSPSQSTTDTKTDSGTHRIKRDGEYYIKDHYSTVTEALSLFRDDPLSSNPGSSYLYSTHGWTVLSAVVESVAKQDFLVYMKKLCKDLGMKNTCAEFNDKIIPHRARFYQRNAKGHLINAPYVDNSYKWAGGGFMSTAEDLVQFGNAMLYARQTRSAVKHQEACNTTAKPEDGTSKCHLPGILRPETVAVLWKIVSNTEGKAHKDGGYGLGWTVIPEKQEFGECYHQSATILHTGLAVGASSILLIRPEVLPHTDHAQIQLCDSLAPPKGVVVAMLVNLQEVNLEKTAAAVATMFEKTKL